MESEKTPRPGPGKGTPPGRGTITPAHGGRIGNPPFVATDEQRKDVQSWAKVLSHQDIATFMGISVETLAKHFRKELDVGRVEANLALGGKLMKKAYDGNLTALIFYLRTRAKWNTRVEITGADGGPLRSIDLTSFLQGKSEEELALIEPFIEQLLAASRDNGVSDSAILGAATDQGAAG